MGISKTEEDTPLHEAVRYGDVEEAREALKKGHDPNQIGLYQWSALHEAVNNGDMDLVKLLLSYGGDPNKGDLLQRCTSLHYAASQDHLQCLRLLLDAGGRWDVENAEGKTSYDVAHGQCLPFLRKLRDKEMLASCSSRENLEKVVLESTEPDPNRPLTNQGRSALNSPDISPQKSEENNSESQTPRTIDTKSTSDIYSLEDGLLSQDSDTSSVMKSDSTSGFDSNVDPDEVSITSLESLDYFPYSPIKTHRAWTDAPVVGVGRKLILGHITLSFEYNSKRSSFKIRVWQVSDLIMPPAETSMISGIYVKSFLLPDKRKDSKRKTEELSVHKPADKTKSKRLSIPTSQIFKPSSFSFSKAPEYKKVTVNMVRERTVCIDVCILQKYTRRSFTIASFNIPMSEAVRNLVKQRYPLTPRMSTDIPENMKVYDGSDIKTKHQRASRSSPNSRVASRSNLSQQERSSSDTNLKGVRVLDGKEKSSIEIIVTDNDNEDIVGLGQGLEQVKITEDKKADEWTSIPMTPIHSDEEGSTRNIQKTIVECDVHNIGVHLPLPETPTPLPHTTTQSYTNPAFDWKNNESPLQVKEKKKSSILRKFSLRKSLTGSKKEKVKNKRRSGSFMASKELFRPESPAFLWDDYLEPLQTSIEPVTFDDDFGFEMDVPVLPMVTSMDIPRVHGNSFSPDVSKTSFTEKPRVKSSDLYHHEKPTGSDNVGDRSNVLDGRGSDSVLTIPENVTINVVNEMKPSIKVSPRGKRLMPKSVGRALNTETKSKSGVKEVRVEMSKRRIPSIRSTRVDIDDEMETILL